MPSQPAENLYEYAVVQFVPSVERAECVNVGLLMMCKRRRWLRCRLNVNEALITALWPQADVACLREQLRALESVAHGDASAIGQLEAHERFRWLTAVRSACIGTTRPHPGKCADLDATFDRLFATLVARG